MSTTCSARSSACKTDTVRSGASMRVQSRRGSMCSGRLPAWEPLLMWSWRPAKPSFQVHASGMTGCCCTRTADSWHAQPAELPDRGTVKDTLIVSKHFYSHTPDDEKLQEVLQRMRAAGAAIPKLATTAQDVTDALRMLQLAKHSSGLHRHRPSSQWLLKSSPGP